MGAHLAMALMASCVHWLPLVEDRAPSLPFVSCTHRCSGQGCTAPFLLRFLFKEPILLHFHATDNSLSDTAFHATEGDPSNLQLCQRGEWEDRVLVETVL